MAKGDKKYYKALKLARQEEYDASEVINLLKEAISLNNSKAAYALATWYLFGEHVRKNYRKGFELLKLATSNDDCHRNAYFDIAVSYETGKGTKKDTAEAFKNYLLAVMKGDKGAIYEVGRCYYYGIGVGQDKEFGKKILSVTNDEN